MEGEGDQRCRVLRLNGQDAELIMRDLAFHEGLVRFMRLILSQTDLDGDFPITRRADRHIVERVGDQGACMCTSLGIIQYKP